MSYYPFPLGLYIVNQKWDYAADTINIFIDSKLFQICFSIGQRNDSLNFYKLTFAVILQVHRSWLNVNEGQLANLLAFFQSLFLCGIGRLAGVNYLYG